MKEREEGGSEGERGVREREGSLTGPNPPPGLTMSGRLS